MLDQQLLLKILSSNTGMSLQEYQEITRITDTIVKFINQDARLRVRKEINQL